MIYLEILSPVFLAIALSIDGFAVGLAYGLKKIKLSIIPIFLIAIISAITMMIAIFIGNSIADFVPSHLGNTIGGTILIIIGIWQLIEGWKNYRLNKIATNKEENPLVEICNIKISGLILQVMREPEQADIDHSGEISCKEALLLGIALNVDAIGAGLGAGIARYSLWLIPIVAITLFIALSVGLLLGKKYAKGIMGEKGFILPGILLIIIGMLNML